MPTILTKKSDTPGSVPGTANLTNLAGGAELAVNTADKRLFSMNSSSAVIELGTNPSSLTCADASFTVARIGSLTISSLSLSNATFTSATITNLTSSSATITNLINSGGTANGVLYLNGSKVATSGSALAFNGVNLDFNPTSGDPNISLRSGNTYRGYIEGNSSGGISFGAGPSATIYATLTSSGNLGIGTSSPGTKLHVTGSNGLFVQFLNSANNTGEGLAFGSGTNLGRISTNGASTAMAFEINAVEKLRLDGSGNLGLGVTPATTGSNYRNIQTGNSQNFIIAAEQANLGRISLATLAYPYQNASSSSDMTNWKYVISSGPKNALYSLNDGKHEFFTAPSGTAGNVITWTQAMTLDASGNLGVGTTSPGVKLDVQGAGVVAKFVATNGNVNQVAFSNAANGTALFYMGAPTSDTLQFSNSAGTERARIASGGAMGVNTTNPNLYGQLTVRWDATAESTNGLIGLGIIPTAGTADAYYTAFWNQDGTLIGSIRRVGTTGAVVYNTTSDRRLKENIASADDAGPVIDAIEIVKHDWKNGGSIRYGVIAQDLYEVAPEAVSVGDHNDIEEPKYPWGVDYSKLVPMLVKEIQSLRARVAQLESK